MAWIVKEGEPASTLLTFEESKNNVGQMYTELSAMEGGWTKEAVAAVGGNMWQESTVNPGQWQIGYYENFNGGYGLGQWTPATKLKKWCEDRGLAWRGNGTNQLKMLNEDSAQWHENHSNPDVPSKPPLTFEEFKKSTLDVAILTEYWLWYWEEPNPSSAEVQKRLDAAAEYYKYLGGYVPPKPVPKRKMKKIYFWCRKIF